MMKTFLSICLSVGVASVASGYEYYEWPDSEDSVTVSTQETDLWPVSNLIQGPGDGYSTEEPHNKNLGGAEGNWVTADDAGFPSDYIEEVGKPVIQFDLGRDVPLKEISTWGYAQGNSNGTSAFSLRFATEAEGPDDFLDVVDGIATINYGESITYNPTFFVNELDVTQQRFSLFEEHVTARYVEFTNEDNHFIPDGTSGGLTGEPGVDFEERLLPYRPGGDRVGLGEVAFMILPDSFQVGDKIPRSIDGDDFGVFEIATERSGEEFGPAGNPAPGLLHSSFTGTAGSKDDFDAITSGVPVVAPFRSPEMSWWSGSNDVPDVPTYPAEVDGVITGDGYSVLLQGEIKIEESGLIQFLDGVDDYTYLAIDTDRSGVAGDSDEEVLINDNNWTDALSAANGGSPIVEAEFDNIADGGEWLAIEFGMSEGGGGDSGMLYWDFGDEDDLFPLEQGDGVEDLDALLLIVPDSNLQSRERELVKADAAGTLATAYQTDVMELSVQVGPDGNDQIALADGIAVGDGVSTLDVSDATIRIIADDGIADGAQFQIFGADAVTGLDSLNLIFDDPTAWDTSSLSEGVLVFGAAACDPNTMGDIDGSGDVAFADFLILSQNFGSAAADHTTGDIDCSGDVAFADFLILSQNFGSVVGAQSVPEPSGLMLLGFAGMLGGCLRRRR